MKKISLLLIALGLLSAPLLVNAIGSSNTQGSSSYEAGQKVGATINETKTNASDMADTALAKMDDAQDAVQAKASEVANITSDAVDNFQQGVADGNS
ncbi:MAG: ABC-type transporter Mla subunit MlaD [Francisella sp.]|jgi:ABC-type transporter Mla subunit MlaD